MANLGGTKQGISPQQTVTNYRSGNDSMIRKVLRNSWNGPYATGKVNGYQRAVSEFKAVSNIGDYLNRQNYACNVPNGIQSNHVMWRSRVGSIIQKCDQTGIPCSNANTKFVPDSSDYTTYKKQRAYNQLYNDSSFGGDQSHGNYVAVMAVRR